MWCLFYCLFGSVLVEVTSLTRNSCIGALDDVLMTGFIMAKRPNFSVILTVFANNYSFSHHFIYDSLNLIL